MTVTITGIAFDNVHYDERGDVLYLNVGKPRLAARTLETAEGHAVHYDERGNVVGVTLLNVKWTLDREGELRLTWPEAEAHVSAEQLDVALTPA